MPPVKPEPWKEVRSSFTYGYVSPQEPRGHWDKDEVAFVYQWDDGFQNEDCLRVNVWTQGLDAGKRPVMVWLHGGGFSTGSAHDMKTYDGENLARRGDVVVVSLNHRVGAVGFLNLASIGGEKYARSGNVGMLDIVAALEWVRDNIRSFGGNPDNVTVFGQSGGGGKVTALMAMPRAAGLFHRAIVQSGSMLHMPGPDTTAKLAEAVLKELGIGNRTSTNCTQFRWSASCVPEWRRRKRCSRRGVRRGRSTSDGMPSWTPWAPTVDGVILPESPFRDAAPAISAKVPLLVGSTRTEFGVGWGWPEFEDFTLDELTGAMTKTYGKAAAAAGARRLPQRKSRSQALRPVRGLAVVGCACRGHSPGFRQGSAARRPRLRLPVRVEHARSGRPHPFVPLRRVAVRVRQHRPLRPRDRWRRCGPGLGRKSE